MKAKIKERPIIFKSQEVIAVLAGDKTQHRIPLSSQPYVNEHGWNVLELEGVRISDQCATTSPLGKAIKERLPTTNAAPYRTGNRLWVQEQYRPIELLSDSKLRIEYVGGKEIVVKYENLEEIGANANDDYMRNIPKWRTALSMPRWASRLLLEITDIRIERVTEITHNDAIAEQCFNFGDKKHQEIPPLTGFASYWREKHGDDAWRSNPYVWVIEFKVVEPSEVTNES